MVRILKTKTMTLFEKLHESINDGYIVRFAREINQLLILVKYEDRNGYTYQKETCLPLSDHFYESRVVDCIEWSIKEIIQEIKLQDA
jgi:hypothetical protein